ncbi:MAG: hypothetical protein UHS50_02630 [Bacteroidaceae bacterium]|nr:hypothetical protein [Bacteroidaceae bacterium]
MAIIRNTASMMLKGKVGATTYYVAESRQLARQAMNNSNYGQNASRTDLQQARRVKWSNLVNFYSANKAWMPKAYEDLKPGVSIFNRFMQLNINDATVALTRSEAQAKIWVPAVYRVSQGSLPALAGRFEAEMPALSLPGLSEISETTTVQDFSEALIAAYPQFRTGDALVCVAFYGANGVTGETAGMKVASYKYYELVIDTNDQTQFQKKYPAFAYGNDLLINNNEDGADAAVFIHTRKSGGKLYVSTQDMFLNDAILDNIETWSSEIQLIKAIASYGESTNVPLAPGGAVSGGSGNDSSTGGGDGGGSGSLG